MLIDFIFTILILLIKALLLISQITFMDFIQDFQTFDQINHQIPNFILTIDLLINFPLLPFLTMTQFIILYLLLHCYTIHCQPFFHYLLSY